MLTVSELARRCGLSRSTLLYYESIRLLKPAARTAANYRKYADDDVGRLEQICIYRNAGLKLDDIRTVLDSPGDDASRILERRLVELNAEIEVLRARQHAILKLLRVKPSLWKGRPMTKDKWISIMKGAGFSDDDMRRWHLEFERSAPDEHQTFLEYLQIPPEEIRSIREWSRSTRM